ncbi:DUF732 domain-containing protein [Pseudonocardia sp. NPDC049635]|uniref:DUF732 domain-containing protein n=1 Tax=Pseudonocardia sp. NPDC049635 TaxID=3155506 RepID=UPI003404B64A
MTEPTRSVRVHWSYLLLTLALGVALGAAGMAWLTSGPSAPVQAGQESEYADQVIPQLDGLWTENMVVSLGTRICTNDEDYSDAERVRSLLAEHDAMTPSEANLLVSAAWVTLCPR